MAKYVPLTYEDAEKRLATARRRERGKPLANNTRLVDLHDGSIGIVLHDTVVVALHADGTQTINSGGWSTHTTSNRINGWSTADLRGLNPMMIYHPSDAYTPAKIQKCRTCKHTGRKPVECWGPHNWCREAKWCEGKEHCDGGKQWSWQPQQPCAHVTDKPNDYHYVACEHGTEYGEQHLVAACEHGKTQTHLAEPCSHGEWAKHVSDWVPCWKCKGSGEADYGTKRIVFEWGGEPTHIDATGKVLGPGTHYTAPISASKSGTTYYNSPGNYYMPPPPAPAPKPKPYKGTGHIGSGTIMDGLQAAIPGLKDATAPCPACKKVTAQLAAKALTDVIVELNDTHKWSREEIADWLESLDADLNFRPSAA